MKDSAIGQAPAQATIAEQEASPRLGVVPWCLACRANLDRGAGRAWPSIGGTVAVDLMMDVSLTDEALELLKLLEKGAKHTPEGTALEQLRQHGFAMGSPLKTHITQQGVRYLAALKAAADGNPSA